MTRWTMRILREVNARLDFSTYDLSVTVDSVVVAPGMLTLWGTIK